MSNSISRAFLPKPKFQIMFSCLISLLAVGITSLVWIDNNIWGLLNLAPFIFGLVVAGNPHAPSESGLTIGIIIQWFIVGFVLSNLISHTVTVVRKS